jgi:hypothetical protein
VALRHVTSYPQSTQTPDYGAFELDNRGDLVVSLAIQTADVTIPDSRPLPGKAPRKARSWRAQSLAIAMGLVIVVPVLGYAVTHTTDPDVHPAPQPASSAPPPPLPQPPAPSPPQMPSALVNTSPPAILDAGAAPKPLDPTYVVEDDDVTGTLVVSGKPGWTAPLAACRSGQVNGFVGVDLDDGSDRLAVRVIVDPTRGKQVLLRLPKSDDALVLTPDRCPGLAAEVTVTGATYNDIRAVQGKVAFDCDLGGGARAKLNARFRDCH